MFGTIDSWLIWNLTGGLNGGIHVTDVTNASRTLLMDIHALTWDKEMCRTIGVPMDMLPEIKYAHAAVTDTTIEHIIFAVHVACTLKSQLQACAIGRGLPCSCESQCVTLSTLALIDVYIP